MNRIIKFLAFAAFGLTQSPSSYAQTVLRLNREQLQGFSTRIRGMVGASELMMNTRTSQAVREAIADTIVAILDTNQPELESFSVSSALTVLSLAAHSENQQINATGWSRLVALALGAEQRHARAIALSVIARPIDRTRGAPILKQIAESPLDNAPEAVRILGGGYGDIGVSTLRQIFLEGSARNEEARKWVSSYALYYKWTR